MIGGSVILCHSLKLGMRRWLVITGDSFGKFYGKSYDKSVASRLSMFSNNHILTEGQGGFSPGRGCAVQVLVLRSVCDIMWSQG